MDKLRIYICKNSAHCTRNVINTRKKVHAVEQITKKKKRKIKNPINDLTKGIYLAIMLKMLLKYYDKIGINAFSRIYIFISVSKDRKNGKDTCMVHTLFLKENTGSKQDKKCD